MADDIFKKLKLKELIKNKKIVLLAVCVCICLLLLYMMNSKTNNLYESTPVNAKQQQDYNSEFEVLLSQINGAGKTNAYVNQDMDTGEVLGVIIVSQGANDLKVKLMLANAASTALSVSFDKIEVFEMQKGE